MARPAGASATKIGDTLRRDIGLEPGFGRLVPGQLDKAQKIAALTGGPIKVAHAPRTKVGSDLVMCEFCSDHI